MSHKVPCNNPEICGVADHLVNSGPHKRCVAQSRRQTSSAVLPNSAGQASLTPKQLDDRVRVLSGRRSKIRARRHLPIIDSIRLDRISDEMVDLYRKRWPSLVKKAYSDWVVMLAHHHPNEPSHRLPYGGWLDNQVYEASEMLGYLAGQSTTESGELGPADIQIRKNLSQPGAPFQDLDVIRRENSGLVDRLRVKEAHVISDLIGRSDMLLTDVKKAIHQWKYDNHYNAMMIRLLNDPRVQTTFEEGDIFYRQSRCSFPDDNRGWFLEHTRRHREHVTQQVLSLEVGNIAHFTAPIGSTTHTYTMDSLMYKPPDWERNPGSSTKSQDALSGDGPWKPHAIKMELAPLKGVYFSEGMQDFIGSHLDESEVLHPNDTYWMVKGKNDVAFADRRAAYPTIHRSPTLQMVEITKAEALAQSGNVVDIDTAPGLDYSTARDWNL